MIDFNLEKSADVSRETHLFLMLCSGAVLLFLLWASIGELAITSTAVGEVIPYSQVKSVQHLEGGIVRKILVREGDEVTKGQELIILESTQSKADLEELKVRLVSLKLDVARLKAEAEEKETPDYGDIEEEYPKLVKQSLSMFKARKERFEKQLQTHKQYIAQKEQEVREIQTRLKSNREKLKFLEEQVKISEDLLKDDLTSRMEHLNLLKERQTIKGVVSADVMALPRVKMAVEEAKGGMDTVKATFLEDVRAEYDEVKRELEEKNQRLNKYEDKQRRTVIRAPEDGIIKTLFVFTVGGVVKAGQTVLNIVPKGDRLVIEAQLAIHDIGYVSAGQKVKVKLASQDASRFDSLDGRVIGVSPDALVSPQGVPFYKVRIETEKDYFSRGKLKYRLIPGVQVICSIHIGQRTVMNYLLSPYFTSAGDALHER